MNLTLRWWPPARPGRTLFVAFAYHGGDRDDERRGLLERFESAAARGHRIVHRDHYANPRPLPYVMAMIVEAAALLSPERLPDLVLDSRYEAALPNDVAARFGSVERADVVDPREWLTGLLAQSTAYDHVALVYPDALGLGCDRAERRALRRDHVLVINGRRRAFRLDATMAPRLRWSRLLAHTRIVERALALMIRPIAAVLARWDRPQESRS